MKKCNKCHKLKPITEFYKEKRVKSGLRGVCKECDNIVRKAYKQSYRTNFDVFVQRMYNHMSERVKGKTGRLRDKARYKGKGICCRWDFYSLCGKNEGLYIMWEKWRHSGYQRRLIPTTDRIDPDKGYELDNIRFIPMHINSGRRRSHYHASLP